MRSKANREARPVRSGFGPRLETRTSNLVGIRGQSLLYAIWSAPPCALSRMFWCTVAEGTIGPRAELALGRVQKQNGGNFMTPLRTVAAGIALAVAGLMAAPASAAPAGLAALDSAGLT